MSPCQGGPTLEGSIFIVNFCGFDNIFALSFAGDLSFSHVCIERCVLQEVEGGWMIIL